MNSNFQYFFEIMEALPFPRFSQVAETNRKTIQGLEDLPILTPSLSGSLGQTSWILEAVGMSALIRALLWNRLKQIIFLKGELDTRPTYIPRAFVPSKKLAKVIMHMVLREMEKKKITPGCFLSQCVCCFTESGCLSRKSFLSLDSLVREILLAFLD